MQTTEGMIYKERKFSSSLTLDIERLNKLHTQTCSAMSSHPGRCQAMLIKSFCEIMSDR